MVDTNRRNGLAGAEWCHHDRIREGIQTACIATRQHAASASAVSAERVSQLPELRRQCSRSQTAEKDLPGQYGASKAGIAIPFRQRAVQWRKTRPAPMPQAQCAIHTFQNRADKLICHKPSQRSFWGRAVPSWRNSRGYVDSVQCNNTTCGKCFCQSAQSTIHSFQNRVDRSVCHKSSQRTCRDITMLVWQTRDTISTACSAVVQTAAGPVLRAQCAIHTFQNRVDINLCHKPSQRSCWDSAASPPWRSPRGCRGNVQCNNTTCGKCFCRQHRTQFTTSRTARTK